MRWATTVGVTVSVASAAALLTGCEKPPPAITVWSGGNSVYVPALCWSETGPLQQGACAEDVLQGSATDGVAVLPISEGQTLGISVDPVVAESGWQVLAGGQPVTPQTLDSKYYRILADGTPNQKITLQVLAGQQADIRGVFLVTLSPDAA